jgi:prephenate dehydratase
LGPAYSFHDILCKKNIEHLPLQYFTSFDQVFEALQNNDIQFGLIAIDNSIHGEVGNNSRKISELDLKIIREYELPISLHLTAKSSSPLSDIKKIYAHPVAWNECQIFLNNYRMEHIPSSSNSQALIDLNNDDEVTSAAISGQEAIQQSGLNMLCKNIHDSDPNITTFALVTKN